MEIPALGNDMMIIATIDNATKEHVYDVVLAGGVAYSFVYYLYKDHCLIKSTFT